MQETFLQPDALPSDFESLAEKVNSGAIIGFSAGCFSKWLPLNTSDRLTKDDVDSIRELLEDFNLSIEPDLSTVIRKLDLAETVFLYRPALPEKHEARLQHLVKEKLLITLAALSTKIDGVIKTEESDAAETVISHRASISSLDKNHLMAIWFYKLYSPLQTLKHSLSGIQKHFESTEDVKNFLADIIIADGIVNDKEVYLLREFYELLDQQRLTKTEAKRILKHRAAELSKKIEICAQLGSSSPHSHQSSESTLSESSDDLLESILSDFE